MVACYYATGLVQIINVNQVSVLADEILKNVEYYALRIVFNIPVGCLNFAHY